MRIVHRLVAATLAAAVAFWGIGCGSGDTSPSDQPADASAPPKDAGRDARPPPPPPVDAGGDAFTGDMDAGDAGDFDAGIDAGKVVPGSPSRALAAGATVSTSQSFKAIRTLGESPGGNGTASSQSYRFHGGLVGSTQ